MLELRCQDSDLGSRCAEGVGKSLRELMAGNLIHADWLF